MEYHVQRNVLQPMLGSDFTSVTAKVLMWTQIFNFLLFFLSKVLTT